MLEYIFGSQTRVKILELFFSKKQELFYAQEIIACAKTDSANTHRELKKLHEQGILHMCKKNGRVYYTLNERSPYHDGLQTLFNAYRVDQQKKRWFVMEEMPGYYPMMVAAAWNVEVANKMLQEVGVRARFTELLAVYEDGFCRACAPKEEFNAIAHDLVSILTTEQSRGMAYNNLVLTKTKVLFAETEKLRRRNLASLTDKQLGNVFEQYYSVYERLHRLHWVQTCADFGDNILSAYLMKYLRTRVAGNGHTSLGDVFSVLTTPTEKSNSMREYENILLILSLILRSKKTSDLFRSTETRLIAEVLGKINPKIEKAIYEHTMRFGWLGYGTVGPGWNKEYFIDILGSLVRQKTQPYVLRAIIVQEQKKLRARQKALLKELAIDEKHRRLFGVARGLIFTKGARKDSMFFSYAVIENLYREISRRRYLSINQVRFLYPHEIRRVLSSEGNVTAAQLNARQKFSIHHSTGYYTGDHFLEGDVAKKFLASLEFIEENTENIKMLSGDCATPGRVRGSVAIVNMVADMAKMKNGNILVSTATSPNLVPAIKQAAAIITNAGGITCHAAIISRELNIPCIVGTRIATKVLANGDIVDVDATHGKVTIIKKVSKQQRNVKQE